MNFIAKHIKHAIKACKFSLEGIASTFKSETAFQQEALALVLLPLLALLLGFPGSACLFIIMAWLLVMLVEIINTALEHLCDKVSPDFDPFIKKAKDAGSAAVFLALCINLVLWIYLFSAYC